MEENKTIYSYAGQVFTTFGVIVTIFIILGMVVGEEAGMTSTLFEENFHGYSFATLLQLLLLAFFITLGRIVFLTDRLIKSMSLIARSICFVTSVIVVVISFVCLFGWFPLSNVRSWIGFFGLFTLCTAIGIIVSSMKEKAENKKMEQALEKIRQKDFKM